MRNHRDVWSIVGLALILLIGSFSGQVTAASNRSSPVSTDCEMAVQAVSQNKPEDLAFSDKEFILAHTNCSPANKRAAAAVWRFLLSMQKGGKKLEIPVKVVRTGKTALEAAVTDENMQTNKPDLHVLMNSPSCSMPQQGATIQVIGVMTSYRPSPFMFFMKKGEIAGATCTGTGTSQ